jgi:hypothetical protein
MKNILKVMLIIAKIVVIIAVASFFIGAYHIVSTLDDAAEMVKEEIVIHSYAPKEVNISSVDDKKEVHVLDPIKEQIIEMAVLPENTSKLSKEQVEFYTNVNQTVPYERVFQENGLTGNVTLQLDVYTVKQGEKMYGTLKINGELGFVESITHLTINNAPYIADSEVIFEVDTTQVGEFDVVASLNGQTIVQPYNVIPDLGSIIGMNAGKDSISVITNIKLDSFYEIRVVIGSLLISEVVQLNTGKNTTTIDIPCVGDEKNNFKKVSLSLFKKSERPGDIDGVLEANKQYDIDINECVKKEVSEESVQLAAERAEIINKLNNLFNQ